MIGAAAIALGNMAPARLLGRAVFRRTRAKKNLVLARADWNLKLVGMDTRISSSCDKLSIGQMRRVALARALQKDPDILLLDEPLAGLDADNVKEVSMMLRKLASLHGKTVLVIEHRSAALDGVVDRVLFLNRGRLETESKTVMSELKVTLLRSASRNGKITPLLQVEELTVQVGIRCVLERFNIELFEGDVVCLTGPNGSGREYAHERHCRLGAGQNQVRTNSVSRP